MRRVHARTSAAIALLPHGWPPSWTQDKWRNPPRQWSRRTRNSIRKEQLDWESNRPAPPPRQLTSSYNLANGNYRTKGNTRDNLIEIFLIQEKKTNQAH